MEEASPREIKSPKVNSATLRNSTTNTPSFQPIHVDIFDEKQHQSNLYSPTFSSSSSQLAQLYKKFTLISRDRDARRLFLFIILLGFVTFLQLFYGSFAGSLGMLSSAFHTSFELISMIISLIAMVLAKQPASPKYSYGYDRVEVLSGFTNGIFLLFVSLFLIFESIEQILEPTEIDSVHTSNLILLALVSLAVNVIGAIFFHSFSQIRAESKHAHDENLTSVAILIGIDVIANAAVILSTYLMSWGWLLADPIIALGIVVLMSYNAIPICKRTGRVLLQTTPLSIQDQLEKSLREASTLEGVLEYFNEHFWTNAPGHFVGSLSIRVRSTANEQEILTKVRDLFKPFIADLTIQVEKDDY